MPKVGGGRVAAIEILVSNSRTREYIEKGEKEGRSITDAMNDGELEGMQTFDAELEKMIREGVITKETGFAYSTNANNLKLSISDLDEMRKGSSTEESQPESPTAAEPAAKPVNKDLPDIDGFEP
jgi:twitching motility protein PilT